LEITIVRFPASVFIVSIELISIASPFRVRMITIIPLWIVMILLFIALGELRLCRTNFLVLIVMELLNLRTMCIGAFVTLLILFFITVLLASLLAGCFLFIIISLRRWIIAGN